VLESGASLCIPEMEEQFFFETLSYSMYLVHSPATAA